MAPEEAAATAMSLPHTSFHDQPSSKLPPTGDETTDDDEEPHLPAQSQTQDPPMPDAEPCASQLSGQPEHTQQQQQQQGVVKHTAAINAAAGVSSVPARLLQDVLGTPDSADNDSEWNPALSGDQKPESGHEPSKFAPCTYASLQG